MNVEKTLLGLLGPRGGGLNLAFENGMFVLYGKKGVLAKYASLDSLKEWSDYVSE